jgi:tetrahydromethanopterin S-methyltransferase subunit A
MKHKTSLFISLIMFIAIVAGISAGGCATLEKAQQNPGDATFCTLAATGSIPALENAYKKAVENLREKIKANQPVTESDFQAVVLTVNELQRARACIDAIAVPIS